MSEICGICGDDATHVLVTPDHKVVEPGDFFCHYHAFNEERHRCPNCDDYMIDANDDGEEYLPTYTKLDEDGCCSEHP